MIELFNFDPPDREGGVSDTIPFPKLDTGDGREPFPLLSKTEHRGR